MEEDHLSHNNFNKLTYKRVMKIIIFILLVFFQTNFVIAAGSDSSSDSSSSTDDVKVNFFKDGKNLIKRAGRFEKKNKIEKAKKLYAKAFEKFSEAYKNDKNNPDILNYMGFTSRKTGNFEKAEEFYLKGLNIDPKHNGINEYLGELYVNTNRIKKANERLEVLKNCNCEEYKDLELIIKTKGNKIY